MKTKPIYKIVDGKGRVLIPKEMREAARIGYGDIVRLSIQQGVVNAKKVELIEVGDQSPEAVEAFVHAAIREMPEDTQIAIAARLLELVEQRKGKRHE
ncbi:MAG TPA: AbrB family transcriptional regulator [Clostridiales bacterium]|nr:AbrB family transcriptional regulator [Clostridiales bacterium]